MVTNKQLKSMPAHDQHKAIYATLAWAKLEDMIPCRWSCEDHEGCDTATMLRVVCLTQLAERTVPMATAIESLVDGQAPRGATPYPDAASALLARRIEARLEYRPTEGSGWYIYVGDSDAGGPFETKRDALAHWGGIR